MTWPLWPRAGSSTRAERKSPATLRIYRGGLRAYLAWCEENGQPAILDRNLLAAFTADLLDRGAEAATAQARHLAVRRFGRWLHAEGELAEDPLAGMRPPKLDSRVIPVLSDDELRRLVKPETALLLAGTDRAPWVGVAGALSWCQVPVKAKFAALMAAPALTVGRLAVAGRRGSGRAAGWPGRGRYPPAPPRPTSSTAGTG